jgi:hypothetical protein
VPERNTKNLQAHNGIGHGDIDHLDDPEQLAEAKRQICADPHTVFCFVSPGGQGLKLGMHIPPVTSNIEYRHAWQAVAAYYLKTYGLRWDQAAKDIVRLCFVSWDPELYINPQAQLFPVPPHEPPTPRKPYVSPAETLPHERRVFHADKKIKAAIKIIVESADGGRHEARLRAGELLGGCVAGGILLSDDDAYDALASAVENNTDHRTYALRDLRQAIEHGHARPIFLSDEEERYQKHVETLRSTNRRRWARELQAAADNAMAEGIGQPPKQKTEGQPSKDDTDEDLQDVADWDAVPAVDEEEPWPDVPGNATAAYSGINNTKDIITDDVPAMSADELLAQITNTPHDERLKMLYDALDTTLAYLSTAELALFTADAKALLGQQLNLNKFQKACNEAKRAKKAADRVAALHRKQQADKRVMITLSEDLEPPTNALQDALLKCPRTRLYQRGHFIVHIGSSGPKVKFAYRPPDMPRIIVTSKEHLRELASIAAMFVLDRVDGTPVCTKPPEDIIATLMARHTWDFPPLEGIVNIPTLLPNGQLLTKAGYDRNSGLVLNYNGVQFPPLPRTLDLDAARTAIGKLQEVFKDFPYVNEKVHFSATLAALLTCLCRYAIMGRVPMFVVRSNTKGSGKGKLIDAISLIALGRPAPRAAQTTDEEEERKRLLSLALEGVPLLHIDNVAHALGSGPLDMALTAPTVGDRLLGKNEMREAPLTTVFFASGNHMQFRSDVARRVIPIDFDPKDEHPELRDNFTHPHLEKWVAENRPRLVMAAVTIMAAYFTMGAPKVKLKGAFGSYEEWSDLIRQALIWAGEADPNEGRLDIEVEADPLYEKHDSLLSAWEQCYNSDAKTLNQVAAEIRSMAAVPPNLPNNWNKLRDALGVFDKNYDGAKVNTRVAGDAIRAMQGTVIDGRRFVKDGVEHGAAKWKIERLSPNGKTTP